MTIISDRHRASVERIAKRLGSVGREIACDLHRMVADRPGLNRSLGRERAVELGYLAREWGFQQWARLARDHAVWEAATRTHLISLSAILGEATAQLGGKWEALTRNHLRRLETAGVGTAVGLGAGVLLGGGSVGIVAFGTGVGIPLIAITALIGLLAGDRIGLELEYLEEQWRAANDRITEAKRRAEMAKQTRFINDDEHWRTLQEALEGARSSLCIRSAFLSDYVVDNSFADSLRDVLHRGVDVYLEYGYRMPPSRRPPLQPEQGHQQRAEKTLSKLVAEDAALNYRGSLQIGYTPTNIKELVVDAEWLVIGSHNWLSSKSLKNSQKSVKVSDPQLASHALADARRSIERHPFRAKAA